MCLTTNCMFFVLFSSFNSFFAICIGWTNTNSGKFAIPLINNKYRKSVEFFCSLAVSSKKCSLHNKCAINTKIPQTWYLFQSKVELCLIYYSKGSYRKFLCPGHRPRCMHNKHDSSRKYFSLELIRNGASFV